MLAETIRYFHVLSLALWIGGLFGYVMVVWPSVIQVNQPVFPRQLLSSIAMRTAPWIYLAMGCVLVTSIAYVFVKFDSYATHYKILYLLALVLLISNNIYGSIVAWPRIMLSPDKAARESWRWFYFRMASSLVGGLLLLSLAIVA